MFVGVAANVQRACYRPRPSRRPLCARLVAAAWRPVMDGSSQANATEAVVRHLRMDLDVLFQSKTIVGLVRASVEVLGEAQTVALDTRDLDIQSAWINGEPAQFTLHGPHPVLGAKLDVRIPPAPRGSRVDVDVLFQTSPSSSALQFLTPEQTAGGKHPYLFSQCQAIHARSFVPCQDTPGAKITYEASVRCPAPLRAVMSAVPVDGQGRTFLPYSPLNTPRDASEVFHFHQAVSIPSYLLAIAVGNLVSRDIGPRSAVWSEPETVNSGAYKFADTERILSTAEALAGPYVWGRYDLLLLPPSFPYGGMENPCLTFVTPTLLAGDRSLVNVVAHEIAHSWTGNLVTNARWEDFWLNEGWTVFLERKIIGRIDGEQARQFHASQGYLALQQTVEQIGAEHNFTRLVPDLGGGVDPDEAFSKVPYEKGSYFLMYLESLVGGPSVFERFLRAYLDRFAWKTVTTEEFRRFFTEYFQAKCPEALDRIDWDTWLFAPGMPPQVQKFDETLSQAATRLAERWHTADLMGVGVKDLQQFSPTDVEGWSAEQTVAFLERLLRLRRGKGVHCSTTRALGDVYGLSGTRNAEIRFSFLKLRIASEDDAALPDVSAFLKEQGRMKYVRPLFRALKASKMGASLAPELFSSARGLYHPVCAKMVAHDLGV